MNLHIKTKVLPEHKIEVTMPELPIGAPVDLVVITAEKEPSQRESILDVIEKVRSRHPHRSAEEIDSNLREERNSWES